MPTAPETKYKICFASDVSSEKRHEHIASFSYLIIYLYLVNDIIGNNINSKKNIQYITK